MIQIIDLNFQGFPQAIAAFLVPTDIGLVLIETGPHSTLKFLREGVNKAGYQLADIKAVLLSHIHLDHAGAAWYLAKQGAKVYVHINGYRHLKDPQRLMSSAQRIYGDKMEELWGSMEGISDDNLVVVEHVQPLEIGEKTFKPWYTPGHAQHHIAWQLNDVLFTGDVAGVKTHNGPVMPPCPPPDIDIERWITSIDQIRKLKLSKIYLTHFGVVEQVSSHLDQLQERLVAWSEWVRPYWEAQTPVSEVVKPFQEYVKNELLSAGLSEADVVVYEAANPSWMSVYGLMRYWKKTADL